jgi:hypothetical protein
MAVTQINLANRSSRRLLAASLDINGGGLMM